MVHGFLRMAGVVVLAVTLAVSASAENASVPRVSRMHLTKHTHELTLFQGDQLVASFVASLGPGGLGLTQA